MYVFVYGLDDGQVVVDPRISVVCERACLFGSTGSGGPAFHCVKILNGSRCEETDGGTKIYGLEFCLLGVPG